MLKIHEDKGGVLQCQNFKGIKLLGVRLQVLEKVVEKRLKKIVM